MEKWNNYKRGFHAVCLSATLVLFGTCIHKSLLDEDDTLVEYRKFHSTKGTIYPSISFCLHDSYHLLHGSKVWGIFLDKNHSIITPETTSLRNDYLRFLNGDLWNAWLYDVDYDAMSGYLERYFIELRIELKSDEQIVYEMVNGSFELKEAYKKTEVTKGVHNRSMFEMDDIKNPGLYISKRETYQKCFSFDTPFIPGKQVQKVTLHLNGTFFQNFPKRIGKGIIPGKKQFSIHYHYPHQTINSFSTLGGWRTNNDASTAVDDYLRQFYVGSMEVVRRRNKPTAPCIDEKYDEKILVTAMKSVGCRHSVIMSNDSYPICNTKKSFMEFEDIWKRKEHHPPCDSIQGLYEWHGEGDSRDISKFCLKTRNCARREEERRQKGELNLIIQIIFTNEFYKEIVYSKQYTLETLIGNTGGYIGKLPYF